jgi:hypothetical protein
MREPAGWAMTRGSFPPEIFSSGASVNLRSRFFAGSPILFEAHFADSRHDV